MKRFFVFLCLFILFSCKSEYSDFHSQSYKYSEILKENSILEENFSLDLLENIDWLSIRHTPDLWLLDELVDRINSANNRVYVEVYIFTEKRLRRALKNAFVRWVDVKVLLEKNVYMAPSLNNKTYNKLKNVWIDVRYSNTHNYSLNHTKMMIIDDDVIISTWNYSYSSFRNNREFFLFLENNDYFLEVFLEIFNNDFEWNKFLHSKNELILSPYNTRYKFNTLLNSAKESIKIYSLNFSDTKIKDLLINKAKDVDIYIIFPSLDKVSNNEKSIDELISNWVWVRYLSSPSNHAKAILVDDKYLYIWSVNFSRFSIEENREIWLLIKNKDIIWKFLEVFNKDFNN